MKTCTDIGGAGRNGLIENWHAVDGLVRNATTVKSSCLVETTGNHCMYVVQKA